MSEESRANDPGAIWRAQPAERLAVKLEDLVNRRTEELHASTRLEIVGSIGAALLLVGVMAWRLWPLDGFVLAGFAGVVAWVGISLYRFRDWIRNREGARADAMASSGLEYHRRELARRRDHLRNEWVWHGPLFLACLILAAVAMGRVFPSAQRLWSVAPLVAVLVVWTAYGIRRRRRQAKELQREIAEVDLLAGAWTDGSQER